MLKKFSQLVCCALFVSRLAAQNHELRILTYNVKMLPRVAVSLRHHPVKRAKLIPAALLRDSLDVIVLQEMFDRRAQHFIVKGLKAQFPYIVGPKPYKPRGYPSGSGVMIISRYPMRTLDKIRFSECMGVDCLAHKGVLLVEVQAPFLTFQVAGTHMQAGGGKIIKKTQHREMGYLLQNYSRSGIPQFAAGDFNTQKSNAEMYEHLVRSLQTTDDDLSGAQVYTSDHQLNDMYKRSDSRKVIDFIFYKPNGVIPLSIERRVCMYRQQWAKSHQDLSDHFAVLLKAVFTKQ